MKFPRREFLHLAAGAAALPAMSAIARAQSYPTRPIRLVVPFPPGGIYDALGRPWADKMKASLGTVIVENIGGAGGGLGGAAVARAQADGHTILIGGTAINVINWVAFSRPLYNPRELEPVALLGSNCFALAVNSAVPIESLGSLVAHAKANPGKLPYGSAGVGSLNHLTGEVFKSLTGLADVTHIPYRGAGPALTDLISGQIPLAVVSVSGQVIDLHRSNKIRILAVTSAKRLPAAPEIPTAVESGVAGLVTEQFIGLFVPSGTPQTIVARIAEATRFALDDLDFQQRLYTLGFEAATDSSSGHMRRVVDAEFALWTPVIKALGLKLD